MIDNNLLKFFRRRKAKQLNTVNSYFIGFENSIRKYENQLIEEEINKISVGMK